MLTYQAGVNDVSSEDLEGFFDGWSSAPSPQSLLRVLMNSALAVLARDGSRVVGFANALSDGELAVYVPLLEVRATHQGQGIGTELIRRVFAHFSDAYMIDVICDPDVARFYQRLGMTPLIGMVLRNTDAPILSKAAPSA